MRVLALLLSSSCQDLLLDHDRLRDRLPNCVFFKKARLISCVVCSRLVVCADCFCDGWHVT
jgi:hypothetical protein